VCPALHTSLFHDWNVKLSPCRSFPRGTRILIFCSTKRMCDQLAWNLNREFGSSAIHGDKKQQERDHVLAAFKVSNW